MISLYTHIGSPYLMTTFEVGNSIAKQYGHCEITCDFRELASLTHDSSVSDQWL